MDMWLPLGEQSHGQHHQNMLMFKINFCEAEQVSLLYENRDVS